MNLIRFLKKCVTDRPAAASSLRVVRRNLYGQVYWSLKPNAPLAYQLPTGGTLLLDPKHAFTGCFWPDVDHYEPDVRAFLNDALNPGDTFIDCGANVGYFSIQAGALVGSGGTVVAIEANPNTFKLLERNLQANNFGIPVQCAVTTQTGEVALYMPSDWDVYSSLSTGGLLKGKDNQSFKVAARTLDDVVSDLALSRVDVVKIDIEGGELDALRSGAHLLSTFRPLVITEYSVDTWSGFEATSQELIELARKFGYTLNLFDLQKRELVPVTDEVWQRAYVNLIMAPEERAGAPLRKLNGTTSQHS